MAAFEKVWNTVNEKHYDPEFGGVDWNKVRENYLPKVKAVESDDEENVSRFLRAAVRAELARRKKGKKA